MQKVFDPRSAGFWTTVLTAVFSILASGGVEFGIPAADIAAQIVTTFNTSGVYAVLGIIVVNVAGPVYNFVRKKVPFNWNAVFSSTTTWVSIGSIAASALILLGFNIPPDTPPDIAAAIVARNWALLGSLTVVNLLIPVIRFIKERRAKVEPEK